MIGALRVDALLTNRFASFENNRPRSLFLFQLLVSCIFLYWRFVLEHGKDFLPSLYRNPHQCNFLPQYYQTSPEFVASIGVGRGGGGAKPPNILGGGANIPSGSPNNPPAFSFNFYVKLEKITNVPG